MRSKPWKIRSKRFLLHSRLEAPETASVFKVKAVAGCFNQKRCRRPKQLTKKVTRSNSSFFVEHWKSRVKFIGVSGATSSSETGVPTYPTSLRERRKSEETFPSQFGSNGKISKLFNADKLSAIRKSSC